MDNKLDCMRYAGRVNLSAINYAFGIAHPGVTLKELDTAIEWYITNAGCKPAFKGYQPAGASWAFPATACISPNSVVVHGVPGNYVLQSNDLLTIDVGTEYKGWFVDAARSRVIDGGHKSSKQEYLVMATEEILNAQLAVIKDKCTLLQVALAAEFVAEKLGVNIMHQWGGHRIGDRIHLPPFIPNAIDRSKSKLQQKMAMDKYNRETFIAGETYCIEPVTSYGTNDIIVDEDGWTIHQKEGQLVAHTERCLLVTETGYELLS